MDVNYYLVPEEEEPDLVEQLHNQTVQAIIDVKLEIEERKRLSRQKLHGLDLMLADVRSAIRRFSMHQQTPESQRLYIALQRELLAAERQALQEPIDCWRDVSRLEKELREILSDFLPTTLGEGGRPSTDPLQAT